MRVRRRQRRILCLNRVNANLPDSGPVSRHTYGSEQLQQRPMKMGLALSKFPAILDTVWYRLVLMPVALRNGACRPRAERYSAQRRAGWVARRIRPGAEYRSGPA